MSLHKDGVASPRQPEDREHLWSGRGKAAKGFRRGKRVGCEENRLKRQNKTRSGKFKRSYW